MFISSWNHYSLSQMSSMNTISFRREITVTIVGSIFFIHNVAKTGCAFVIRHK